MTVKLSLVDGNTEIFETDKFVCAKKEDMNPDIMKVEIFNNAGKKIYKLERFFKGFYKKYLYKPVKNTEQKTKEPQA